MSVSQKSKPKIFLGPQGLRVLLVPLENTQTLTFLILVKAGSEYETKEKNGLSHFLEHMCFKGTERRPTPQILATEFDSLGAEYNAFTSYDSTGYFAKAANLYLENIVDLVADIYLHSLFNPSEIEKEKGVIIEEMNYLEDNPLKKIYDLLNQLLYGDQPAGRPIIGRKEVISKIKQKDFFDYKKQFYTAKNTLIVVAGNFSFSKLLDLIKKQFEKIPRGRIITPLKTKIFQKEPRFLLQSKKTDQAHLILSWRAFPRFDKRRYPLAVLETILGKGMSSRLFQKIREELGAAYYIHSFSDLGTDRGVLGVSAGIALEKVEEVLKIILEETKKLKEELVSLSELKKAKDYLKGQITLDLETSDQYAFFYGLQQLFYNRLFYLKEIFAKIDKVNPQAIRNLARQLFQPEKLNLAMIAPFSLKEAKNFEKILKNAYEK